MRLEGVLQSWGEMSKWNHRDTATFPTKSGIIGLIGCAMGIPRGNDRLVELSDSIDIAVRADRAGEIDTDYQTVSSPSMLTAERKPRTLTNTIITPRAYLCDASFLVAISSENDALLDEIEGALKSPKWTLFLGRKACVPSQPITGRIVENYEGLMDALVNEPLVERHDSRVYVECRGDETSRPDVLLCAKDRKFARRGVQTTLVYEEGGQELCI